MRLRTGLALQIGQLAHAELTHHFWRSPYSTALELHRRQDGYDPEFGSCGFGLTCAEACGNGFEACSAKETSMLFCYNPGAGQKCCPGGSGRACNAGFYCASDPDGGQTYCCDEQLDLAECASDLGIPTVVVPTSATSTTTKTSTTKTLLTTKTTSTTSTTTSTSTSTTSTTSSRSTTTSPTSTEISYQTSTTTQSSLVYPPTSVITTALTSSKSANYTTTGLPTSAVVTAEAPTIPAMRGWGMGVAVVGWAVMG